MRTILRALAVCAALSCWPAWAGQPPYVPAQVPRTIKSGIIPAIHLRQAAAKAAAGGTVTVCIAGDSTSVGTPAGVHPYEGLWFMLQRRLQEDNPSVSFNFQDYGVPGSTIAEYNSTVLPQHQALVQPGTGTGWLINTAVGWATYVKGAACDLVFFNWGVNDAQFMAAASINSAINVSTWSPIPDIVWITGKAANPAAGSPYGDAATQAGYLANDELVRTVAKSSGYGLANGGRPMGLIDLGRYFQQALTGLAPLDQSEPAAAVSALQNVTTFPVTLPQTSGDFDVKLAFPGALASLQAGSNANVTISIGSMDGATSNSNVTFTFPTGGINISYTYNGIAITKTVASTASDAVLEVAVKNGVLQVWANTTQLYNTQGAFSRPVVKPGAPFSPQVSIANFSGSGKPMNVLSYSYGRFRRMSATISPNDAFGLYIDGTSQVGAGQVGGNGINHDTSIELNDADWAVLQATDFCFVCSTANRSGSASVTTAAPASGATVAVAEGTRTLKLKPSGAIASLTVTLPPNPKDNDVFEVLSSQTIMSLTVAPSATPSGQAVSPSAATMAGPGTARSWLYDLASTTWIERQ